MKNNWLDELKLMSFEQVVTYGVYRFLFHLKDI